MNNSALLIFAITDGYIYISIFLQINWHYNYTIERSTSI